MLLKDLRKLQVSVIEVKRVSARVSPMSSLQCSSNSYHDSAILYATKSSDARIYLLHTSAFLFP